MSKTLHFLAGVAVATCVCLTPLQTSADGPLDKLGRGAAGLFLGFLEIPGAMWETTQRDGLLMALTVGWIKGIGFGVAREFTGVYEILTFPFAGADEYQAILLPAYPWDRFRDEEDKQAALPSLAYPVPRGKLIIAAPPPKNSRPRSP